MWLYVLSSSNSNKTEMRIVLLPTRPRENTLYFCQREQEEINKTESII